MKLIDDVQRKAIRLGVIAEFTPVAELIAENDQKLLHKVLDKRAVVKRANSKVLENRV